MITTIIILGIVIYSLRHFTKFAKRYSLVLTVLIGFLEIIAFSDVFIVSNLYEEKTTSESNIESTEIYALKDSASKKIHTKAYNGIFVTYGLAEDPTSYSTYKYCSEVVVGDRKVKAIRSLKARSQDVFFDDTLKDGSLSRLNVVKTTETKKKILKQPNKRILYLFFLPGSTTRDILYSLGLGTKMQTQTQYIFVVPEGSVTEIEIIELKNAIERAGGVNHE